MDLWTLASMLVFEDFCLYLLAGDSQIIIWMSASPTYTHLEDEEEEECPRREIGFRKVKQIVKDRKVKHYLHQHDAPRIHCEDGHDCQSSSLKEKELQDQAMLQKHQPIEGTSFFMEYIVPNLIRRGFSLSNTTSISLYDLIEIPKSTRTPTPQ